MHVLPTANASLQVEHPTPDVHFDFGNPRLYAAVDGQANITRFQLPEGIPILAGWKVEARLDGAEIEWEHAEAAGRSWTLSGTAVGARITVRTACDGDSPALYQVWTVTNPDSTRRVFTLGIQATFDLRTPVVHVGPSAPAARMYRFLREHPLPRVLFGTRRWSLLNFVGEYQKRIHASSTKALEITAVNDGFVARGALTATLRAGAVPAQWQPGATDISAQYRGLVPANGTYTLPFVIAAGDSANPTGYRDAFEDADAYAAWLAGCFEHEDLLLRSMYAACVNVAVSSYKELPSGFAGLWAGPGYNYPPRTYFRDSYWTALPLLPYRPRWVRSSLLTLAAGVHGDGRCPSGLIDLTILPFSDQEQEGAADWLSDHQDSPAYFVLLLHDYLAWTGDRGILDEHVPDGRTLWYCAHDCLNRLIATPAKDRAPNDWADNVLRSEWVTYDLALLHGALLAASAIARSVDDPDTAATYNHDAQHIGELLQIHLWDAERGYFADYRRTGDYGGSPFLEDHLPLDSLMALRFGAANPDQASRVLLAVRDRLETRNNIEQHYGDWGVMACWPPYHLRADLFGKSADPLRYHNGAVWPYLNAIYAQLLLERDDPGWRYPLSRWWEVQLEKGWLTPVEFFAPPFPPGAFLQGWSGMAASAMLVGGAGVTPTLGGTFEPRMPPWGPTTFRNLNIHGVERTITVDMEAEESSDDDTSAPEPEGDPGAIES
jgi:hypothetical protein